MFTNISPSEARPLILKKEVVIVDVRENADVQQGIIPGATHLPYEKLESEIRARIPDLGAEIIVYCNNGTLAPQAAKTLRDLRYENVRPMSGGFSQWKDEGKPWSYVLDGTRR